MSTDPNAVFANPAARCLFEVRLEPEVQCLLRAIELFAQRGVLPRRLRLDPGAAADAPCRLMVDATIGEHDARVLAARLATQVGVFDARCVEVFLPAPQRLEARAA
jgi:hypothetical protein